MSNMWEKTLLVCNSIKPTATFTTESCGETFKIQSGCLNCNSKNVLHPFICKVCCEASYFGKPKLSFDLGSITITANIKFSEKEIKKTQNLFQDHYCLDGHLEIEDSHFTLFEKCETHK